MAIFLDCIGHRRMTGKGQTEQSKTQTLRPCALEKLEAIRTANHHFAGYA
jgi:hypothetical protein